MEETTFLDEQIWKNRNDLLGQYDSKSTQEEAYQAVEKRVCEDGKAHGNEDEGVR